MVLGISGTENDVAEAGSIDPVRVAFAFQADAGMPSVRAAEFSDEGAIEGGAGVKLKIGFRGGYGEPASALGMDETGRRHKSEGEVVRGRPPEMIKIPVILKEEREDIEKGHTTIMEDEG